MGQMLLTNQIAEFLNQLYFQNNDKLAWFFACWYKFRKIKDHFNNFSLIMIKNGCGLLDYETLKYLGFFALFFYVVVVVYLKNVTIAQIYFIKKCR